MKNRPQLLFGALALASFLALTAAPSFALIHAGTVEGSWVETDRRANGDFTSLLTSTRDQDGTALPHGEAIKTYFNPDVAIQTTGHGEWEKIGDHEYAITSLFLNADGTFVRVRVRENIKVNDALDSYTGTFETEILDAYGNVLETLPGTVNARRVQVKTVPEPSR